MQNTLLSSESDRDRYSAEELHRRFSDREQLIQVFENALCQSPPVPVLMFHGIGGIGKTYLMRYLMQEYGRRWKDATSGYPHAFLSFRSGHTPTSAERALWQAREQLIQTRRQIVFPRFDFVWGKLWERSYHVPISQNKELLPEDVSWISELLQSSELVPVIGDVAKAINSLGRLTQHVRNTIAVHSVLGWFRDRVEIPKGSGWKVALQSMDPQELTALLPAAFAADLADGAKRLHMSNDRIVIFIDNYETLQEQLGESFGKETINFVQVLAKELVELKSNALIVIAGRNRLRWAEVRRRDGVWVQDPASIWAQEVIRRDAHVQISRFLEQYVVGDLSEADARQYLLEQQQLTDPVLISQICDFAGGYPLALGVVADLISEAGAKVPVAIDFNALRVRVLGFKPFSEEWREEVNDWLLERLIEQLKLNRRESLINLTKAAAIPRWFNQELLFNLIRDPGISEEFRELVLYSFVEPYEVAGIHSYRLHPLMRKLLRQNINIHTLREQWEKAAANWFEEQASIVQGKSKWLYYFEMLYHLWQLNPDEAAKKLKIWFTELESVGEYDLCWELLNTSAEVENILPLYLQVRLNLYKSALYKVAWHYKGANRELGLQHAEKAVTLAKKSGDGKLIAEAYNAAAYALIIMAMGVSADSRHHFARAVEMLQNACEAAESVDDRSTLASALLTRASMETDLNPDYGNFSLVNRAIDLYQQIISIHAQRGAYFGKAILAMRLKKWELVEPSLKKAEELNQQLSPLDIIWQAHTFQVWGEYYAQRQQWEAAKDNLEKAKKTYEEINFIGGICAATGWLGIVQCHLGEMIKGLNLTREALRIERDILGSQEGVAKWLYFLGELFIDRNELERALQALWLSESLREALSHSEIRKTQDKILEIKDTIGKDLYERLKVKFRPSNSEFGEYAFLWGFDSFLKYEGNPILTPQGDKWEAYALYNPTAWTDGENVYLLYRAEGPCAFAGKEFTSRIGLAISNDGIHFTREPFPLIEPTEPYEIPGGCEDPRIVCISGTFYLTYNAYDGKVARLAMAMSKDLRSWEKFGPLFPDDQWERFFPREENRRLFPRGWSKSGAILEQQINGYYWMYFGDTHIWVAYSRDLRKWEIVDEPILSPRPGSFDSRLVEPGPPPLLLPEGIWLGYNGADLNLRYTFGQAMFAVDNPTKLIRRCARPLLEPTSEFENRGRMPQVVFGEGLVQFRGKWFLYYGMADSRIGVAIAEVNNPEIGK